MAHTAGIYLITLLKPDGSAVVYVGQSNDCRRRELEHFGDLRRGVHHNTKMQRAFSKYGREAFTFEIVEQCRIEELSAREGLWLERLAGRPGSFNIAVDPDAPARGIRRSEETRRRMSAAKTGRRHSAESRKLIGDVQRGRKNGPCPPERARKIAEAQRGAKNHSYGKTGIAHHRSKPVIATNIETGAETIFGSSLEAQRAGFSQVSISGVCNGKWRTHRGHTWRFATPTEIGALPGRRSLPEAAAAPPKPS